MFGDRLSNVRKNAPLIHNITNYVTVTDVANMILACGASPIMSHEPLEADEITAATNALNINIGTLTESSIKGMFAAGEAARRAGHPIILDPVGAGASRLRTETALELMKRVSPTVIRGNISEIKSLAAGAGKTAGVDASVEDKVTDDNLPEMVDLVKGFAKISGSVIAVSGAIDLVADSETCCVVRNGRPAMSRITGTGCQLSGLTAAFCAANEDDILGASAAAVCTMGLAGEIAWRNMEDADGNSTYRNRIIDAVFNMTSEELDRGAIYEYR